jgi:nitrate/nitrite transporter NarK
MRLVAAALLLIILASFYHVQAAELLQLAPADESQLYQLAMFWAAAFGGYGVMVMVFGFVRSPLPKDAHIRLLPVFFGICALIALFFYLVSSAVDAPEREEQRRLRPGETVTI